MSGGDIALLILGIVFLLFGAVLLGVLIVITAMMCTQRGRMSIRLVIRHRHRDDDEEEDDWDEDEDEEEAFMRIIKAEYPNRI